MSLRKNPLIPTLALISVLLGGGLLILNVYGLTQELRPDGIEATDLRFGARDVRLGGREFLQAVDRLEGESPEKYAARLTGVIADGLAHVHWLRYPPDRFNQRVPAWENYVLYLMGVLSGIPEFERYHFSSPEKSMERGIGICGDASILMSQLLSREGIPNQIINFPGHIVVEADFGEDQILYDPDFGVALGRDASESASDPEFVAQTYLEYGFSLSEAAFLSDAYSKGFKRWSGPEHFITRKFYFEKFAYGIKWALPVGLVIFGIALLMMRAPAKSRRRFSYPISGDY